MEFFYFFGERVEVFKNGVDGGSGEVKGSAPILPSIILAGTGDIPWLNFGVRLYHE
jgi:hypothetical protein